MIRACKKGIVLSLEFFSPRSFSHNYFALEQNVFLLYYSRHVTQEYHHPHDTILFRT